MTLVETLDGVADIAQASFELLVMAGNGPNMLFIGIGFVLLFLWLAQMSKDKKKALREGTLE